jgi:Ca-activated chloride channel family protein
MSDRRVAAVVLVLGLLGSVRVPPSARAAADPASSAGLQEEVTQGALRVSRGGAVVECPLRHTDVQADVSGFLARVRVTQTFENPYDEPVEAVYVFPLPYTAAVDDMTMVIGERRIVGLVRRRTEARVVYEQAIARGQTASLLEQERPNIFTQTVGNIRPGQQVRIEISYVDVLPYDQGSYEFHFPMVVGPRYIPGAPLPGRDQGEGWSPDTTRVPDASRITPPVLKPGFRTGHDVALRVAIDAGVGIHDLKVTAHQARVERPSRSRATAVLSPADAVPNKDFVLTYKVAGERPETAVLAHAAAGEPGYFLLMMQPRDMEDALRQAPPRDVCFLIDVSGSMSGEPTRKVIDAMGRFFERMRPQDRLQVITFAGSTSRLFETYVPATPANLRAALGFTDALRGGGGTEMLAGIKAVLADPVDLDRVRMVVMLTDGYIGNEGEIIAAVGRRAGDQLRFWTVGIGSSPNRFLLEGVARQGGGMSAVLGLKDDPTDLVGRIAERIQRAQLSRIEVEWGGLDVTETFPARVPELWAGRPVVLLGRYEGAGPTIARISGLAEGQPMSFPLEITLPERDQAHAVLAKAWARRKIQDLSDQLVVARGDPAPLEEEITELALRYRLMSAHTSFVAVDESEGPAVEEPRPPRRVLVPVPMPEGVSYEGVFGDEESDVHSMAEELRVNDGRRDRQAAGKAGRRERVGSVARVAGGAPGGIVGGVLAGVAGSGEGGVAGGVVGGAPAGPPLPPPPPRAFAAPYDMTVMDAPTMRRMLNEAAAGVDPLGRAVEQRAQAGRALERARTLADQKDWSGALRQAQLAWVFEEAHLRAQPWNDDGTRAKAVGLWRKADEALREAAIMGMPALKKRLNFVIRNADLPAAVGAVARAAGVTVTVAPGALDDASALTGARLRLAWLDLRRATAAQAFTWLAQPFGLEWTVERAAVVVRSARSAPGPSVWTYDVRDLAAKAPADLETSAERVVGAGASIVRLLTLDRLLLMGDRRAHAQTAEFLAALRKGSTPEPGPVRERAASRAAVVLDEFSWALLAAACERSVDDEAASELLEALADRDALADVSGRAPILVWRTLWATAQARAIAPEDTTLRVLADTASAALGPVIAGSVRNPVAAAYVSLLRELPVALQPAGLDGVPAAGTPAKTLLAALAREPITDDDHAVLASLAQRLAGRASWNAARDQRANLTGVSAGAFRVLNRLERARLAGL